MNFRIYVLLVFLSYVLFFTACEEMQHDLKAKHPFLNSENIDEILGSQANWNAHFPGKPYSQILASKLVSDPKLNGNESEEELLNACILPMKTLFPAHIADVQVALNLAPRHPYLAGLACHEPDYAFFFQQNDSIVGRITLSSNCSTLRFAPASPFRISLAGFCRLLTVLEELKLLAS